MTKKALYHTIILPDSVFTEIKLLQNELSKIDDTIWTLSDVINLLLRFTFDQKHGPIYNQKEVFLKEYLYGKELFLEKFSKYVCMSTH